MDHAWGYGSEQRLREENQDCFGVFDFDTFSLAIVCDGMGGHVGGAQASSLAVRTIHDAMRDLTKLPLAEALVEALKRTNLVIYEAARKNHRLMGMGTTVVVAAIQEGHAYIAHVGDSRAYRVRGGQVQQLTRDHTMVNLFVDAELLTPEDAATHPEAHVLSRSLGVERQVDVEISEPMELQPNDVLFLCSDGVHGVVTDWELANVDWGAPHEGVRHVLDLVSTREGDDNATAVAVMMGTSFEDVPPTPVPDPKRMEDAALGPALTAVPVDDENTFDSTPSYRRTPDSGGASYVVYEDHPVAEPPRTPTQTAEPPPAAAPAPTPAPVQAQAAQGAQAPAAAAQTVAAPKKKKTSSALLKVIPVVVGGGLLAVVGLGAMLYLTSGDGESDGTSVRPLESTAASVKVDKPMPVATAPIADPSNPAEPQPPGPEVVQAPLFAPDIPPAPRRLPHRSACYRSPPPGGQVQFDAVNAARNKECARSLSLVRGMIDISIEYAALYQPAWLCFTDAHQLRLEQARVESWEDFRYILPHFEGTPEAHRAALEEHPALEDLPARYRPAVDGIEFRLEHYADSDNEDKLADVLSDLFGDPTMADQLAVDLHLVVLAAEGLSRVEDPSDEVAQWWARRVYVATKALNGRVGRVIERHRHELIPVFRELLKEATEPRELPNGTKTTIPAVVLEARDVALGKIPPPNAKPVKKDVYVPPKDLDPEDLEVDGPVEVRGTANR